MAIFTDLQLTMTTAVNELESYRRNLEGMFFEPNVNRPHPDIDPRDDAARTRAFEEARGNLLKAVHTAIIAFRSAGVLPP